MSTMDSPLIAEPDQQREQSVSDRRDHDVKLERM
jgi:hypothetical protein